MARRRDVGWAWIRAAAFAVLIAGTQGCRTIPRPPPVPFELSATEAARMVTVGVDVSAKGDAAGTVAGDLANTVQNALSGQFKVTGAKPDVQVTLGVSAELHAGFGEYKMYKGDVDASARRTYDNNLLGKRKFSEKGERALGEGEALKSLAGVFDEPVTQWVAQTVTPAGVGLKAMDVTVSWNMFQDLFGLRQRRDDYARVFVEEVSRVKGVAYCELVAEDMRAREQTFRVVYYPEEFRAGLLNTLAKIEALKIKQ